MHVLGDGGTISEVANRVAHQLAGAVIGDVATPVDLMDLGADGGGEFRGDEDIGAVAEPPHGVGVGMLEQQQVVVRGTARNPALVKGPLQVPGLLVGQPAEPAGPELGHASSCSQSQVSRFSLIRLRNITAVDPSKAR